MVSFEIFVKAMPPSLSELKVLPSFCFAFKIPDDVAASNLHIMFKYYYVAFLSFLTYDFWDMYSVSFQSVLAWIVNLENIKEAMNQLKPNSRKKVFFSHSNYLPDKFYQKKVGNKKN